MGTHTYTHILRDELGESHVSACLRGNRGLGQTAGLRVHVQWSVTQLPRSPASLPKASCASSITENGLEDPLEHRLEPCSKVRNPPQ